MSNSSLDVADQEMDGHAKMPGSGYELNEEYGEISDDSEGEEDDSEWNPSRRILHRILRSTVTDIVLGGVIAVSLVVVIIETDETADGSDAPETIHSMNIGFTVLYALELVVRLYVYRLHFFYQWFNVMDFIIVALDIGLKVLQQSSIVSALRIFRLAKLGRVLVLLEKFPELHMILRGIYCTMKSIFWGMCLLGTIILIWSVLGTQLIHPINKNIDYGDCERCSRAFSSVSSTFLTIFQTVVAGDSWGTVAVPVIEKSPLTLVYFVIVFVSISLLVLNLILATTVERASAAKDEDQAQLRRKLYEEKRKAYAGAAKRLKAVCEAMDRDRSKTLSVEELEEGFRTNREFHNEMKAMDIKFDDMQVVFKLLDADRSGDVDYEEFVESLHMMKTRDSHTLLMFTYQLVEDILQKSSAEMRLLTSKTFVNRISDEVTKKTLTALAPLLDRSTKLSQETYDLVEAELQDNEAPISAFCGFPRGAAPQAPPRKEEDVQVSSEGLKAFRKEEVLQSPQHPQDSWRGQPKALAPSPDAAALVVVPPVPLRSEAEVAHDHAGGSHGYPAASHSEVDSLVLADHDHESNKLKGVANSHHRQQAANHLAVRFNTRGVNEESLDQPRHHEGIGISASAAADSAGERGWSRKLPYRWRLHHARHHSSDIDESLAHITTTLQHMEQAIYSMGGAGRHAQWCPACAPDVGRDAAGGSRPHHIVTTV